jgi:uncharacterized protein (TIGR02145 family)
MLRVSILFSLILLFVLPTYAVKPSNSYKDPRDKQKYRTIKVGSRLWLADNLNYKMDGSFCYKDDESQCMAYGRLYTWDAAVNACPQGFHLPTDDDFQSLWQAAGAAFTAAYLLKAAYGWSGETNGSDTLKFSAMPAGNRFDDETYGNLSKFAFFWSSEASKEKQNARVWYMTSKSMAFSFMNKPKIFGFSVRCVQSAKK